MDERKRTSAKKTAADRKQNGQQRQAEAKKVGAGRVRSGQQRQEAVKRRARMRGVRKS